MHKKKKEELMLMLKNENVVVAIGFGLIFLVIIFTLLRSYLFTNSSQGDDEQKTSKVIKTIPLPYKTISSKDLNNKILGLGKKEPMTMLDIRQFSSYIQEHIVDSINITPDEFPVSSKIDAHSQVIIIAENSKDKDITTVVEKLKDEKIENVLVLAGGMESWKQIIGATVSYGDPKSFVDQSKVAYLDPQQLKDALDQQVPVYIIDVRSKEAFAKGHVAGAKNIPFDELEKRRNEIKEKRIVVLGENELQEFQASVQIYDMLLASPFIMRTAMPGWQSKQFPLIQ
jgi:rhodanese-related sulfurtransferase